MIQAQPIHVTTTTRRMPNAWLLPGSLRVTQGNHGVPQYFILSGAMGGSRTASLDTLCLTCVPLTLAFGLPDDIYRGTYPDYVLRSDAEDLCYAVGKIPAVYISSLMILNAVDFRGFYFLFRHLAIIHPSTPAILYVPQKAWVESRERSRGFSPRIHPSRKQDVTNGRHGLRSFWLPWAAVSASETCFGTRLKYTTITGSNGSSLTFWPCCFLVYHFSSSKSRVCGFPTLAVEPLHTRSEANHHP